MMRSILIGAISVFFMSTTYAQALHSSVSLGGGVAAPTQSLKLPLQPLVKTIKYNVNCTLVAPDSAHDGKNGDDDATIVHIFASTNAMPMSVMGEIKVNDVSVGFSDVQTALLPGSNHVSISNVITYSDNGFLVIQNADQQDAVQVNSCVAVAAGK